MTHLTLLDGGMGRELQRMGAPFKQPEWSALALMEAPESVFEAHRNFIKAGADVITVNSYALVPYHIGQDRFDARGVELMTLAVDLARRAADQEREESGRKIRVAACLPPIFGSYRPNAFDVGHAIDVAGTLIDAQREKTDLWLIETVALIAEAQLYLSLLQNEAGAIWLSYSLDDEAETPQLRSGEGLEDALDLVTTQIDAALLNCSTIEAINRAIPTLIKACHNIPCGVYANAFGVISQDVLSNISLNPIRKDVTPLGYKNQARKWIQEGVSIIGGCCGITPDHISAVQELRSDRPASEQRAG